MCSYARKAQIDRNTLETSVSVALDLDSSGDSHISTGCGFVNHMLELLAFHGRVGLKINASGDTHVDYHHLTEDVGICMGQALREALGDRTGIARYGSATIPMDEALCLVALDLGGRPFLHFNAVMPCEKVGDFDTELVEEFMRALSNNGGLTLHVDVLHGSNTHHIIECIFKALGRALRQAAALDDAAVGIPSSKGLI